MIFPMKPLLDSFSTDSKLAFQYSMHNLPRTIYLIVSPPYSVDNKRNRTLFRNEANLHHSRYSALKLYHPTSHDDIR
jgi:hypothetical protein